MKILIISAHPDDETIGMGGTILKLAGSNEIYWMIMTKAFYPKWSRKYIASKKREIKNVAKAYGIKKVFEANFKAASMSTYSQQRIGDKVAEVLTKTKPDIVYIPPLFDCHLDHEITANALLSIARTWNGHDIKRIFSYELPVTSNFSEMRGANFHFNFFENINSQLTKKLEVMSLYKTELKNLPHPRSTEGLKIYAMERGLRSGYKYAEAFNLLYARNS